MGHTCPLTKIYESSDFSKGEWFVWKNVRAKKYSKSIVNQI